MKYCRFNFILSHNFNIVCYLLHDQFFFICPCSHLFSSFFQHASSTRSNFIDNRTILIFQSVLKSSKTYVLTESCLRRNTVNQRKQTHKLKIRYRSNTYMQYLYVRYIQSMYNIQYIINLNKKSCTEVKRPPCDPLQLSSNKFE